MPVYEYRCRSCGHQFEIQQSFTDDALSVCPQCAGELRKVFAPVGISFKGSGFYKTDSRSGSSKSGAGSAAGSSPTSEGGSGAGSGDGGAGGAAGAPERSPGSTRGAPAAPRAAGSSSGSD